jgi:cbb3-type cytochrome oxidase subunit 3
MMSELFSWFLEIGNSKIAALLIFFSTFIAILIYVYGSKSRSERLESYRDIPFLDDGSDTSNVKNDVGNNQSETEHSQKKG